MTPTESVTYKIKVPAYSSAIYFTIDDKKRLFVNSKHMDDFQWILPLMEAYTEILENGGSIETVIALMKSTFDPRGSYHNLKGEMRSIVHHLGCILEEHALTKVP